MIPIPAFLAAGAAKEIIAKSWQPLAYLASGLAILASVWLVIGWDERRIAAADKAGYERASLEAIAQIEKGNAEIQKQQAERAIAAGIASARAEAERESLPAKLSEMENANAALPKGDSSGLDRERARLLR